MKPEIKIELFGKVRILDEVFLYIGPAPGSSTMVFQNPDSRETKLLNGDQLARALTSGAASILSAPEVAGRQLEAFELAPPKISPAKLMEGKTRRFVTNFWDGQPANRQKRRFYGAFLGQALKAARAAGLAFEVTERMLEADLKKGAPGHRHLSFFISKRGTQGGRKVDHDVETQLQAAVRHFYRKGGRSYDDCISLFTDGLPALNAKRLENNVSPTTTTYWESTIRRRILAARNHENVSTQQNKRVADAEFRGSTIGRNYQEPLELVVIDNTVIDVHVVDSRSGVPLGRPVLSVAICVTTRCIVGYLISFEPPSTARLLTLVKRVISDKSYVKKIVPDLVDEWNHYGIPQLFLLDRALENLGRGLRESCASIGIDLDWAPPENGQYKAWVEVLFRTFNTLLFHTLPGAVAHSPKEMRLLQLKPASGAVLTLKELEILVVKVISVYENRGHSQTKEIPSLRMRELLRDHPRRMLPDIRMIDELIGETAQCNLWTYGINLRGNRFQNSAATSMFRDGLMGPQLALKGKRTKAKSVQVTVRYDAEDCSRIVVVGQVNGKVTSEEYTNIHPDYAVSLSFRLDREIRQFAKFKNMLFETEPQRLAARVALAQEVDALFEVGTPGQQRRAREVMSQRDKLEALELSGQHDDPQLTNQPQPEVTLIAPPGNSPTRAATQLGAPPRGVRKSKKTQARRKEMRAQLARKIGEEPEASSPDFYRDTDLPSFLKGGKQ